MNASPLNVVLSPGDNVVPSKHPLSADRNPKLLIPPPLLLANSAIARVHLTSSSGNKPSLEMMVK